MDQATNDPNTTMGHDQMETTITYWNAIANEKIGASVNPSSGAIGVSSSNGSLDIKNRQDPLNWTWGKKHLALVAMCYMAFSTDFLAGYGVPMIVPQSMDWSISLLDASRSLSGNTFTQGVGSLVAVPFAQRFGTLPVLFWSTLMTWITTMLCPVTPGWIGFIAVRVLQGLFSASAQILGLTMIQEMFFFEEHARKVGIWGWSVLIGPYFGPFISAFILLSLEWRYSFSLISAFVAIGFLMVVFLMDETAYDRRVPENNPPRPVAYWKYKLQSLSGVMGYRTKGRKTLFQGVQDICRVFIKPQFACLWVFHGLTYMWSVGINGTLVTFLAPGFEEGGYGFGTVAIGLMYFSPITAIIIGELFGHFVNDDIQARSIKRNKGNFVPEVRLWAIWPAAVFMVAGLFLLGAAIGEHWHWLTIAFFWGLFVFSAMTSTVAISSYILDCFPENTAVTAALLNFSRVLFGFLVPLFQKPWANSIGAQWSFACQAAICVVAFGLVPVVQFYGAQWRKKTDMCPDHITVESH